MTQMDYVHAAEVREGWGCQENIEGCAHILQVRVLGKAKDRWWQRNPVCSHMYSMDVWAWKRHSAFGNTVLSWWLTATLSKWGKQNHAHWGSDEITMACHLSHVYSPLLLLFFFFLCFSSLRHDLIQPMLALNSLPADVTPEALVFLLPSPKRWAYRYGLSCLAKLCLIQKGIWPTA